MRHIKLLSVLLLTGIITACGGSGTSAPSEYMVKIYPNDFDRFEEVGPVSSRDACTAKAMEMKAAAYECQPK